MISMSALWLPILISTIVVFFASFLAWMVLPHHKKDVRALPDERGFTARLNDADLTPGIYMWPNCDSPEDMKSEEFKARYAAGPWGNINILPAQPNFGMNLLLVFMFYAAVSVVVAYLTGQSRAAGDGFMSVIQVAGPAALLGYAAGSIPNALFFAKPARFMLTDFTDALAYSLLTAVIFAWLWPAA